MNKLKIFQNIPELKNIQQKEKTDFTLEESILETVDARKSERVNRWTSNTAFNILYENLLLDNRTPRIYFHDGKHLKKSKNDLFPEYTFFDFYEDHYKNTFIDKSNTPHMIITAAGMIVHLDNINYKPEIVEYLNQQGLEIYFYESIFFDSDKHKREFVNTFDKTIPYQQTVEKIKTSIVGKETTSVYLDNLYSFELEKVRKFVIRNGLTNVKVGVGEYNIKKYLQDKYPEFAIETDDIFLSSMFVDTDSKRITAFEYNNKLKSPASSSILYKFWCGNRRYDGYRHLTVAYLPKKYSLCSYQWKYEDSPFEIFDSREIPDVPLLGHWKNHLWFDIDEWKNTYPQYYTRLINEINSMPSSRSLDVDIENKNVDLEFIPLPNDVYQKCFCAVVTEAKFAQPFGHFTEKTLNAIKCFRPFILVAPPYSLEYLKTYGIETFSDVWDESYDQEENHEKRLIKIFEVIDEINKKSVEELREIYESLRPRLEKNYQIIKQNIKSHQLNQN